MSGSAVNHKVFIKLEIFKISPRKSAKLWAFLCVCYNTHQTWFTQPNCAKKRVCQILFQPHKQQTFCIQGGRNSRTKKYIYNIRHQDSCENFWTSLFSNYLPGKLHQQKLLLGHTNEFKHAFCIPWLNYSCTVEPKNANSVYMRIHCYVAYVAYMNLYYLHCYTSHLVHKTKLRQNSGSWASLLLPHLRQVTYPPTSLLTHTHLTPLETYENNFVRLKKGTADFYFFSKFVSDPSYF